MTPYIEVLTEGASDMPVMHELLARHFGLEKDVQFRVHRHALLDEMKRSFVLLHGGTGLFLAQTDSSQQHTTLASFMSMYCMLMIVF